MIRLLLLILLLAGCAKGADADLQYIGEARSLAAEWALVNQQASEGKLNRTYVVSMHKWIRDQLKTNMSSLSQPEAPYAAEMQRLSEMADDSPAAELKAQADKLKTIEDSLEST